MLLPNCPSGDSADRNDLRYLLGSKHDPSPQARRYALSGRRNTETGAQLCHSLCCKGSLGLSRTLSIHRGDQPRPGAS